MCMKNIFVKFSFTLNGDFNSLTTAQLDTIKDEISAVLSKFNLNEDKPRSAVTFEELRSSSIVIVGTVAS